DPKSKQVIAVGNQAGNLYFVDKSSFDYDVIPKFFLLQLLSLVSNLGLVTLRPVPT
ncbi:UNVERIFIED_CONTAM: hypothetical protein Sindi_3017900, partial [Sesamum indicum]